MQGGERIILTNQLVSRIFLNQVSFSWVFFLNYGPLHYSVLLQHTVINLIINFKQKQAALEGVVAGFSLLNLIIFRF